MLKVRSIVDIIVLNVRNQIKILIIDSPFDAKYACEVITHTLFIQVPCFLTCYSPLIDRLLIDLNAKVSAYSRSEYVCQVFFCVVRKKVKYLLCSIASENRLRDGRKGLEL